MKKRFFRKSESQMATSSSLEEGTRTSAQGKTRRAQQTKTHRRMGALVTLCFAAALALVVGTGAFSPNLPFQQDAAEPEQTPAVTEPASSTTTSSTNELVSVYDPALGEYEKSTVLVYVNEPSDVARINAILETCDFAVTKDVSGQDTEIGLATIVVKDEIAVPEAMEALGEKGLESQPNYIYHILEDENYAEPTAQDYAELIDALAMRQSEQVTAQLDGGVAAVETSPAEIMQLGTSAADLTTLANDEYEGVKPNDALLSDQWSLQSMDLFKAWGIQKGKEDNATSPHVSVAIVDTGCKTDHEDLVGQIVATYNSSTDAGGTNVDDQQGHGTHVAGIVSGNANNGIGVAGTSYDAGLAIVKASTGDTGSFSTTSITRAYTWIENNASAKNIRVINMSLGGKGDLNNLSTSDRAVLTAITSAKNKNIMTVCAAGNSLPASNGKPAVDPPYNAFPGDYEDCLSVINLRDTSASQTGYKDSSGKGYTQRDSSSNYNSNDPNDGDQGKAKDISAPGTLIQSTYIYKDPYTTSNFLYYENTGTSMAAPGVSGVAALMFAYDPSLSPDDVQNLLQDTATRMGPNNGWNAETGYGEVDAYHALQVLSAEIAFDTLSFKETRALSIVGGDDREVDMTEWSWVSMDPSTIEISADGKTAFAKKVTGENGVTLKATNSRTGKEITKSVKVEQLDLQNVDDITIDPVIYTGSAQKPEIDTVMFGATTLVEGVDYTVEYGTAEDGEAANINAGENAVVRIVPTPNSTTVKGVKQISFTIEPAEIEDVEIEAVEAQVYNGQALTPSINATFNGIDLSEITDENQASTSALSVSQAFAAEGERQAPAGDYRLSYANNTKVALAAQAGEDAPTITIEGDGNFKGTTTVKFNIVGDLSDAEISIPQTSYVYTSNEIEPVVTVTHPGSGNSTPLVEDSATTPGDYRVIYSNNVNAGTATITLEGVEGGAYITGDRPATKTFTITKANLADVEIDTIDPQPYERDAIEPTITARFNNNVVDPSNYTLSYENNTKVCDDARVTATATAQGNFTGSKSATFSIIASIAAAKISGLQSSYGYTGSAIKPTGFTVTYLDEPLVQGEDFDISYGENINAGEAAGEIVLTGKGGFAGTEKHVTFAIDPIDITNDSNLTISAIEDQAYTGGKIEPTVTVSYKGTPLNSDSFTCEYENNIHASTDDIKGKAIVHGQGNYTGTQTKEFTIYVMLDSDLVRVSGIPEKTPYTGKAIQPQIQIKLENNWVNFPMQELVQGVDYTVNYGDNLNKGTGSVIITGKNTYCRGTLPKTFTIEPADINGAEIADIAVQKYTGQAVQPKPAVTFNGKSLTGSDFTYSYGNNTEVGNNATVTINGQGNFAGSKTKSFTISADISDAAVTVYPASYEYTGNAITPAQVTVQLGSITLNPSTDYTVAYQDNINKGTGKVLITGKGRYSGTVTGTFEITSKPFTSGGITVDNIPAQVYTGNEVKPSVVVRDGHKVLKENTDYTLSYYYNTEVGTGASVGIVGMGNYSGRISKSFTIAGSSLLDATISISDQTYTGAALTPDATVKYNNNTLHAGIDYELSDYTNNTNAGTAACTITGVGSYAGSKRVEFKINAASLSGATVEGVKDKNYTGSAQTQDSRSIVVKLNGKTLTQNVDYTISYANNINAGTATMNVNGKGNYTGTVSKTFQIVKATGSGNNNNNNGNNGNTGNNNSQPNAISIAGASVSSWGMTRNATGGALAPGVSVSLGGRTLGGNDYYLTYNGSANTPTSAGTYNVVAVGKGSYSGSVNVGTYRLLQGPNVAYNTPVKLASVSNSHFVLDASGATPKIGANVSIWSDNGGNNQKWYLILGSDGYYTIQSTTNSNFVLDAAGSTPRQGSNISIWTRNGGNNQKWLIENVNGSYVIKSVANENLVLDAAGKTPSKGANVSAWTSNGGNNQKWTVSPVTNPSFDQNRTYEIMSVSNSDFVLDAAGKNPSIGANVSIWTRNGGLNQKWYLVPDGNGYYYIRSASNTGFLLDAAGRSPYKGSNISIWTDNWGWNQRWKIEPLASGAYMIRSAANQGLVLDASGANPRIGANVTAWSSNGGYNQKWWIR